ncbi:MAG: hypothetical protein GC160_23735 [Acidobacteria bacterium]|nr:hypothetical protein [Acidobacteriota bacterium]
MRLLLPTLLLALPAAGWAADHPRLENPIIFQRQEVVGGSPESARRAPAQGANGKLWVMEGDGSNLRQLTFGPSYDEHPSLFADQEHVLYSEFDVGFLNEEEGGKLVKLNIYTGAREVVDAEQGCALHHASVSPIGDKIAYHYNCGKRFAQAMDLGKDRFETLFQATNGVRTSDGIIAMHEKKSAPGSREVALIHIRGRGAESTAEALTDSKVLHRRPAISPDEKLLAWQTNAPDGGEDEIYLADIDGSHARNLTKAKGNDGHPWFSRDGQRIVFESDRSGHWEIWVYDLKTGKQTQLTDGKGRYESTRARM